MEIRQLKDLTQYTSFIDSFDGDENYADPMLVTKEQKKENLLEAAKKKDNNIFGIFREDAIIGIFNFLIIEDEQYIEMIAGLSRDAKVYRFMVDYLIEKYCGFSADFVYNPKNEHLNQLLKNKDAEFEKEQQKMLFDHFVERPANDKIVDYSEKYREQYLQIHTKDMYWVGEKVIEAKEKFRTFLAIEDEQVVGYIDVTHCFEENEPYDLLVKAEYRRKGYGAGLLHRALEKNRPKKMMLLVDIDNEAAIALYEAQGFVKAKNQNNLTAHWVLK